MTLTRPCDCCCSQRTRTLQAGCGYVCDCSAMHIVAISSSKAPTRSKKHPPDPVCYTQTDNACPHTHAPTQTFNCGTRTPPHSGTLHTPLLLHAVLASTTHAAAGRTQEHKKLLDKSCVGGCHCCAWHKKGIHTCSQASAAHVCTNTMYARNHHINVSNTQPSTLSVRSC